MTIRSTVRDLGSELRSYWQGPWNSSDPGLSSFFGGGRTLAGVPIDQGNALELSPVWSAVSRIAADIAALPLMFYKRTESGKDRFEAHPLYRLLHDEPNDEYDAFVMREAMQAHLLTWGNAYAEIIRNGAGQPTQLWMIEPNRVEPFRRELGNNRRGPLQYRVDGATVLNASEMLHIRGFGFNGMMGYSVIGYMRQSLGLTAAAERFGATFFGNGATFGGILTHPGKLAKETRQGLREALNEQHQGADKAHKFLILGDGMKYDKLGIPPDDAQFLETRTFQIREVARWYNIPPHKLGDLADATFSNVEQQKIDYVDTLRWWATRWEKAMLQRLVAPAEKRIQFFAHNFNGMLRGDSASRGEYYSKMFMIGAYSINDILGLEDLNGIGPDGDVHFVPYQVQAVKFANRDPLKATAAQQTGERSEQIANALLLMQAQIGAIPAETRSTLKDVFDAFERSVQESLRDVSTAVGESATRVTEQAEQTQSALLSTLTDTKTALVDLCAVTEAVSIEQKRTAGAVEALTPVVTELPAVFAADRQALVERLDQHDAEGQRVVLAMTDLRTGTETLITAQQRTVEAVTALEPAIAAAPALVAEATERAVRAEQARTELQETLIDVEATLEQRQAEHAARTTALEQQIADLDTQRRDAVAQAAELLVRADTAEQAQATADNAAEEARAAVTAAEARAAADLGDITAAHQAALEEARTALKLAEEAAESARTEAETARMEAKEANREVAELSQALHATESARAAETEGRAEADAVVASTREELEAVRLACELAQKERSVADSEAAAAAQRMAEANARAAQSDDASRTAEAVAALLRKSVAERSIREMESRRVIYADAMDRMVRREVAKAKAYQATPAKLRTWLDNFYDSTEEAIWTRALVPSLSLHVAVRGASTTAEDMAMRLVRSHFEESKQRMAAVIDAGPDGFGDVLQRLLTRWESERATQFAAALVAEEIHGCTS